MVCTKCTPKITQPSIMTGHIVCRAPIEIHYFGRSVFENEVNAQKGWKLKLGVKNEFDAPIYVFVGFQ